MRGTRPKHRAKPHKLRQVGATPTPATSLRPLQCSAKAVAPKRNTRRRTRSRRAAGFGPASQSREAFRLPDCKSGVAKQTGSDDWSVTSASHHLERGMSNAECGTRNDGCLASRSTSSRDSAFRTPRSAFPGLVAQSAERPVVCGRVEGATPFGSANFQFESHRDAWPRSRRRVPPPRSLEESRLLSA